MWLDWVFSERNFRLGVERERIGDILNAGRWYRGCYYDSHLHRHRTSGFLGVCYWTNLSWTVCKIARLLNTPRCKQPSSFAPCHFPGQLSTYSIENISLSDTTYRSGKFISNATFWSVYSKMKPLGVNTHTHLFQPLTITRFDLIWGTRRYFGALKYGLTAKLS